MTKKHKESIPFADIDDDSETLEELRSMIESQLNNAFKDKELDELTYRRLSIEVCEVHGEPYDYFIRIMLELREALEANMIDRLFRAGEFIDSIGADDPRYERAIAKYERMHDQFRRSKEWSA